MVMPLQILMNVMKKINVMSMLLVTIHLEATPALAIVDTLEMELTAQVCKIKQRLAFEQFSSCFCHDTDINECEDPGDSVLCDVNAECTDTEGSYECECKTGYSGDEFNCSGKYRQDYFYCYRLHKMEIVLNQHSMNTRQYVLYIYR